MLNCDDQLRYFITAYTTLLTYYLLFNGKLSSPPPPGLFKMLHSFRQGVSLFSQIRQGWKLLVEFEHFTIEICHSGANPSWERGRLYSARGLCALNSPHTPLHYSSCDTALDVVT